MSVPPPSKARLLIVDPEPASRTWICGLLERAGHQPLAVAEEVHALEAFEKDTIALLILNVHGRAPLDFSLIKLLRFSQLGKPPLRVLVLLESAGAIQEAEMHEAGVDAFVTKPVNPTLLLGAVERLTQT